MSINNSVYFFYFLLCYLQKKISKNQAVKIKHLNLKITFNKRSSYPMTKMKTNTHFLTKLLHPHQKFHVFFTVHIHPQTMHCFDPPSAWARILDLVSKKGSTSPLKTQYTGFTGWEPEKVFRPDIVLQGVCDFPYFLEQLEDSIFNKMTLLKQFLPLKIWQKIKKLTTHVLFYVTQKLHKVLPVISRPNVKFLFLFSQLTDNKIARR